MEANAADVCDPSCEVLCNWVILLYQSDIMNLISKTQIGLESLECLVHLGDVLEGWVALVEEIIFFPKITPRPVRDLIFSKITPRPVRDFVFSKITPRPVRNFFSPQDPTKTVRDYYYFQDQTKTVGKKSQVPYKHESTRYS